MCSRGSVIPLFIDQIKAGNPITITDPNMTRFLMNLDEAVDLVLFAFQHANPGDLFIQKSDASTIGDLAKAVQQLFGDTGTNIIGTRHGEKLFETLMTREERLRSQDMGHYFRVAADNRDLNYDKFVVNGEVHTMADESYTSHNTTRLDVEGTVKKILTTEYVQNAPEGHPECLKKKLLLVGAGGFGRIVVEQAMLQYDCAFVDDGQPVGTDICGIPVVGSLADLPELRKEYGLLVVGIGNNRFRAQVYEKAKVLGFAFPNIVAPSAYISPYAKLGCGCVVLQNACVQNGASVGNGVLLNAGTEVHCDAAVGDYALIYTNSVIRTGATVGNFIPHRQQLHHLQ